MSNIFPGSALRERREALGLSLKDMHKHIHVPITHLEAIESGHFDVLPEPAYVRGFVQSYCAALEIDAEPFLLRLPKSMVRFSGTGRGICPDTGRPGWITEAVAWGSVCLLVLFGWFAYSVVLRPLAENAAEPAEAGELVIAPPQHFSDEY